jgi:maleylpyruvate isomerase
MNPKVRADIDGCRGAHRRLFETLAGITDEVAGRPSRLTGWTVGHVLTHLARNADSMVRRLEGAARDEVVDQYPGGYEGRAAGIEAGSGRGAAHLVEDVRVSSFAFEEACDGLPDEAWARYTRSVSGALLPAETLPFGRWREVEVHHVDLGLGFGPEQWSEGFVNAELPRALATVPQRLSSPAARRLLCAWLLDRASEPGPLALERWE